MRAGSLFSGIGMLDFGLSLAGIEHAWFCEAAAWRRLLRGVDARPARKVVRSRLSALGDGVQVQAGEFLGRRLLSYEQESSLK